MTFLFEKLSFFTRKDNYSLVSGRGRIATLYIFFSPRLKLPTQNSVGKKYKNFPKNLDHKFWEKVYFSEVSFGLNLIFFENEKNKCSLLVVNKKKSFDQSFKGDFSLENNLINRKDKNNLNYIYTGLQIIKPEVFSSLYTKIFSINKIWDKLIESNELYGMESNIDFLHVSTLDIYKSLLEKKFKC